MSALPGAEAFEAIRRAGEGAFAAGAFVLELGAFAIILVAAARAFWDSARIGLGASRARVRDVRLEFGKALVLALEFLVAADVLQSAVAPTLDAVIVVAIVVVIRTILSLTIEWELRRVEEEGARGG